MSETAPTDAERTRAFKAAVRAALGRGGRIREEATAETLRLLKDAEARIATILAGAPTDFETWRLSALKAETGRVVAEMTNRVVATAGGGLERSHAAGVDLVDAPLAAAGVRSSFVAVDRSVLDKQSVFMTSRLQDVTATVATRINGELGLVMTGVSTPTEAVARVAEHLEAAGGRAQTIVRTELGRAWSSAAQTRMEQAAGAGLKMMKQWRRSGRRHPRHSHEAIDGQVQPVDKPFELEGGVRLMFPRDPKGPAAETINCGCVHLPLMRDWSVLHPKERPFTAEELIASPHRRLLEDARHQGFAGWVDGLLDGRAKADGSFETVGRLDDAVTASLKDRGVVPATREIAIADRQIVHAARDAKTTRGAALPANVLRDLSGLMERPAAVYLDKTAKGGPTLVYALDAPADPVGRTPRVVVKVGDADKRLKHHVHNWIATAGYEDPSTLASRKRFDRLWPREEV